MARFFSLFFLFIFLYSSAFAQHITLTKEKHAESSGWTAWLSIPDKIDLHIFNETDYKLAIIDNGDYCTRYTNTQEAMQHNQCIAGINGGFFSDDAKSTPLGLLIADGITISKLSGSGFISAGVLYDTGSGIKLERKDKLSTPIYEMKQAIQSGPFLVENGKVVAGLNKERKARRTFIATDGKGTWCIGSSTSLSLYELATWLSTISFPNGNKIRTAFNLDGGTSSGYWDSTDRTHIRSFKKVRNYVGITPRNTHSPST